MILMGKSMVSGEDFSQQTNPLEHLSIDLMGKSMVSG